MLDRAAKDGGLQRTDLKGEVVRVVEGNEEPVVRERVLPTPYLSEDDAIRMGNERAQAAQQARAAPPGRPPGAPPSSGLYVPGRD